MRTFRKHSLSAKLLAIIMSFISLTNTAFAFDGKDVDEISTRCALETVSKAALEPLSGLCQIMAPIIRSVAEPYILYSKDGASVGLELTISEIQSDRIKLKLLNSGEKYFNYQPRTLLKRYSDGAWRKCPVVAGPIGILAIIRYLGPGESLEISYELSSIYGELPPGDYQIELYTSEYDYQRSTFLEHSYKVACRFTIADAVSQDEV